MAAGFYSDQKVAEIRDRASIVEVVSDFVNLRKAGRNYKGLCPFHPEKTPSFMVSEEKQIFHCFGCGEGGDVFTFVMKTGHLSFPEAVEQLARRYGIRLDPQERKVHTKGGTGRREVLFQINQAAQEFYHEMLMQRQEGGEARRYLAGRGLNKEIIETFRLGWAPDRWDGLTEYLRAKGFPLEMAAELGLLVPKRRQGWYDLFRGRIIFPVFDLHQRVVGFGGRLIQEGNPKYLNSSESLIYHKGEILYGLHLARQAISEQDSVIIVEGYFDLLALNQHGFRHGVATLGTALTPQHVRTLKRYTRNIVMVFDGDQAGLNASLRTLPILLEEEIWPRILVLPEGEDPDAFLGKGRGEEFQKMLKEAIPLFDYFLESRMRLYGTRSIDGRAKVAEEAIDMLRKLPDGIRRDLYVKILAEKLDVKESTLFRMLTAQKGGSGQIGKCPEASERKLDLPKPEELVVRLMIHYPELIPRIEEAAVLEAFENQNLKAVGMEIAASWYREGKIDLRATFDRMSDETRSLLSSFAIQDPEVEEGQKEKIIDDCIQKIYERRLRKERGELLKRIREAEKGAGGQCLDSLLARLQELACGEKGPRRAPSKKG